MHIHIPLDASRGEKKKAALMISKQTNYLIHNTSPLDMPLSNTLIYIFE